MKIENCKLKIIFLSSIFYLLSSVFLSVPNVFAETTPPSNAQNPHVAPNTNPDVPKNLHTYTQNVIIEIMSAVTCQLTGIDPTNPNQQCLGVDQKTGKIGFIPSSNGGGGAIGVMSHMISVLYTIPIHSIDYVNYLAQNFGIAKPAYAQGAGFEGLKPLLNLWTAFRNIVYLIFTIVFVVIGLLIMFRVKIDPRTVMTIQNQIPKIIVGIVLVTFSYAIAGFLIDMMYTSIYLIGNVTTSTNKKVASDVNITGAIQSDNPFSAAHQTVGLVNVAWQPAKTAGKFIEPLFDNQPGKIITGIIGYVVGTQLEKIAKSGINVVASTGKSIATFFGVIKKVQGIVEKVPFPGVQITNVLVSQIMGISTGVIGYFFAKNAAEFSVTFIAFLIILIAILWSLFKLWFTLIYAYIYILIDVVFAPFWIAGGLIPGQPITFGGWLRHILSFIAAFPVTIGLFLLGKVFISAFGTTQTEGQFVPPLIGNPSDANAIGAIIGLGIILLASNVVNMTTKAFNAPRIDLGRIGQAIGVGAGIPINIGKGIGGTITASREIITTEVGPEGQAKFGRRQLGGAIFGRIFGR